VSTKSRVGEPAKGSEPLRRSKEAVMAASLAAAYELLTEFGLSGVSIDEVSRRSGVAKTTIYRHWPSRTALLFDRIGTGLGSTLADRPVVVRDALDH